MKRLAVGSVLAVLAVTMGCASGGTGLSSRDLAATDLAGMQYSSLYELLETHNRVRVATPSGADGLFVRARGQRSLTSGDIEGNPGRPAEGVSRNPPGGGGGGEDQGAQGGEFGTGSSQYTGALLYVDGSEESDPINWLRDTSLSQVERLRILRPSEASSRFGGSGDLGAIAVTMKKDD